VSEETLETSERTAQPEYKCEVPLRSHYNKRSFTRKPRSVLRVTKYLSQRNGRGRKSCAQMTHVPYAVACLLKPRTHLDQTLLAYSYSLLIFLLRFSLSPVFVFSLLPSTLLSFAVYFPVPLLHFIVCIASLAPLSIEPCNCLRSAPPPPTIPSNAQHFSRSCGIKIRAGTQLLGAPATRGRPPSLLVACVLLDCRTGEPEAPFSIIGIRW
jgi:hypothetical protein